ncbi:hypothetical protein FSP39_000247 [Pinctada imbricata]|uniref:RING-type domain-containing protein n=1 Tax=Pinctada imbricata TaxID=66713 RepID=A0AA89BZI4_PINIB|nr:hypothetical protein FSP39_000247 [Pinctada imbricata]
MLSRSAHQQLRIPESGVYSPSNFNRQMDDTDSNHGSVSSPLSNAHYYGDDIERLCHPARFPNYQSKQQRLQTYASWIKHQSPQVMADAGLYYTYHDDSVRCFQCGIGLSGWEAEDDPYVEHARWSPQCEYIIAKKGRQFIQLVQEAVESQSMIGGHLTGQLIMEEILSMEESGERTQAHSDGNGRRGCVETDGPQAATSSSDLRSKLVEENQAYKDMTTCKICTTEPVGIVFLPCGHLVCCPQCAPALKKCPMCRKPVKGTVRVSFG